jgi:hypothetical protein
MGKDMWRGRGGRKLTSEKVRGAMVHKAGGNTNMTDCISTLNSINHC